MTLTVVVFLHVIATCGALGTMVLTDMRLLARLVGYRRLTASASVRRKLRDDNR